MAARREELMGQTACPHAPARQGGQRQFSAIRLFAIALAMALALTLGLAAGFATAPTAYAATQSAETSTAASSTDSTSGQAAAPEEDKVDPNATVKVVLLCVGIPAVAGFLAYLYKSRKIKAAKEAKARKDEIAKRGL